MAEDVFVSLCMQSSGTFFSPSVIEIFTLFPQLSSTAHIPTKPLLSLYFPLMPRLHSAAHGYYSCTCTQLQEVTKQDTRGITHGNGGSCRASAPNHKRSWDLAAAARPQESVRGDEDESGRGSETKTKSDRNQTGARATIVAWNRAGRINWEIAAAVSWIKPKDWSIFRARVSPNLTTIPPLLALKLLPSVLLRAAAASGRVCAGLFIMHGLQEKRQETSSSPSRGEGGHILTTLRQVTECP